MGNISPGHSIKRDNATENVTACERVTPKKVIPLSTMRIPSTESNAPTRLPTNTCGKNKFQLERRLVMVVAVWWPFSSRDVVQLSFINLKHFIKSKPPIVFEAMGDKKQGPVP